MTYNKDAVDRTVLALLYLTTWRDESVTRSWKGHDWDALDRLFEKGMIGDPKGKAKSIILTEEGEAKSAQYFQELFGETSQS